MVVYMEAVIIPQLCLMDANTEYLCIISETLDSVLRELRTQNTFLKSVLAQLKDQNEKPMLPPVPLGLGGSKV